MKKGRENNQFLPRKFVLSEIDNTIKYYVKVDKWCNPFLKDLAIYKSILGSERPESSDQDIGHQCCIQSHKDSFPQLSPNWLSEGERTKCIESAEKQMKRYCELSTKYFSRMVRHVTSMCTTTTPKRWWTGTTPSDAVSCIFCRFPSWQWCKFTHKWQESYHDSPTNYKNLETFGKRKHNYCSPNYKSCLMITWFRLLIPPSRSLNSLSI